GQSPAPGIASDRVSCSVKKEPGGQPTATSLARPSKVQLPAPGIAVVRALRGAWWPTRCYQPKPGQAKCSHRLLGSFQSRSILTTSSPSAYPEPIMRPCARACSRYISTSSPRHLKWLEGAGIASIFVSMVCDTLT